MQKLIFLFLLVFAAGLATAQTTTTSAKPLAPAYAPATCCDVATAQPEQPCLEERPEWTKTAEAQTVKCERSAARVQVIAGGPHWPVFRDIRTDDVFALVYVEGKGYHRVLLPEPTMAKAD